MLCLRIYNIKYNVNKASFCVRLWMSKISYCIDIRVWIQIITIIYLSQWKIVRECIRDLRSSFCKFRYFRLQMPIAVFFFNTIYITSTRVVQKKIVLSWNFRNNFTLLNVENLQLSASRSFASTIDKNISQISLHPYQCTVYTVISIEYFFFLKSTTSTSSLRSRKFHIVLEILQMLYRSY